MFGVNADGNSVVMYIHGFLPYFYVPAWEGFTNADVQIFGDALNGALSQRWVMRNMTKGWEMRERGRLEMEETDSWKQPYCTCPIDCLGLYDDFKCVGF